MSSGRDDGRGGRTAAEACDRICCCFSCRQRREAFGAVRAAAADDIPAPFTGATNGR